MKLWAKHKGIYSNVMGYLGGVNWAILVIKICQMYPNFATNKMIERFFMIYSQWKWEEDEVHIHQASKEQEKQYSGQVMKIIVPTVPFINSSDKVSKQTLSIMKE